MARRTFFSFHYLPDVWRAMNVRKCLKFMPEEAVDGFFDNSVFEASKRESEASLKAFLRDGMKSSSVTCVLSGARTSERRWVRYEIVRAILKGNGLLTIDIDGVKNEGGYVADKGRDPLSCVGLYKTDNGMFFAEVSNGEWIKYGDYTSAVPATCLWFDPPSSASVIPLSAHCMRYDFATQNGQQNIAGWIETAAGLAGR
ncbi:TIR domain-containing protein [Starkeya koreensis]|uniref:TIR domain-containing protein n=1 Tax=Ancylobacter koreensis TaxID=266121 RepID=A0ABT0DJI4_9HYPH|nr:TIR domain-containing protein [Ancylobacter koreensis]MCK0207438.1 TIR domain-containing protein [Ancylobacter koreensis]